MLSIPQEYFRLREELSQADVDIGYAGLTLEPIETLPIAQQGYGILPSGPAPDWNTNWIVVGHETLCGDPVFIDAAAPDVPGYTASHGAGSWKPTLVAPSSRSFFEIIHKLHVVARGRESPVKLKANPIPDLERNEFLSFVATHFKRGVPDFWSSMLEVET